MKTKIANLNRTSWIVVIAISLILVVLTVIRHSMPDSLLEQILSIANLASELNFAVWWSAAALLLSSLLAYERFSTLTTNRRTWLVLSAALLVLAFDEIGSIHETMNLLVRIIVGSLGIISIAWALWQLYRDPETRRTALLIFVSFGLFGSVIFQEIAEFYVQWPPALGGIRSGIEEGTELVASVLILYALSQLSVKQTPYLFGQIIPNPFAMFGLRQILPVFFVTHLIFVTFFIHYLTIDIYLGNPAVFYPLALLLLVACAVYWKYVDSAGNTSMGVLALVALSFSALTVYSVIPHYLILNYPLIPQAALTYGIFSMILIVTLGARIFLLEQSWKAQDVLIVLGLLVMLVIGYLANHETVNYIVSAVFVTGISSFIYLALTQPEKHATSTVILGDADIGQPSA
jgi:hypothetical protein